MFNFILTAMRHIIGLALFFLILTGCNSGFDALNTIPIIGEPKVASRSLGFDNVVESSLKVVWQSATDEETEDIDLEYKLVCSNSAINSIDAASSCNVVMDWTKNVFEYTASGLNLGSTYHFNVMVRDEDDNIVLYSSNSSGLNDMTAPNISARDILVSDIDVDSLRITWAKAQDNGSKVEYLSYKVLYRTGSAITDPADESTSSYVNIGNNGWATDINSATLEGLTVNQPYYINVLVKDEKGNTSVYTSKQETPSDRVAPTVSNGAISVTGQGSDNIIVNWSQASDNHDDDSTLEYKVVYSAVGAINSVTSAEAATIAQNWAPFTTINPPYTISSLNPNTAYNINIIVRDDAGTPNKNIYTNKSHSTDPQGADVTVPVIGTPAITVTNDSANFQADISWTAATDDQTAVADLEYKVVSSPTAINNTSDFSNGTVLTDTAGDGWVVNSTSLNNIAVADGRITYFKVAVKDQAGNIAYYNMGNCDNSSNFKSSLKAYWKFNHNYEDSVGSFDGSLEGSSSWTTGVDGTSDGAFNFNGSTHINMGDWSTTNTPPNNYSVFTDSNQITISVWIKVNNFDRNYQTIIAKGNNMWRLSRYDNTDKLHFAVNTGIPGTLPIRYANSSAEVNDGQWHHVAGVYDGTSGDIHIYIDGERQDDGSKSGGTGSIYNFGWGLYIGNNSQDGYRGLQWNGAIDDVRFYNDALSDAEIKSLAR